MEAPELTVIVAVQDGRGQTEECLRRLSSEQTLARDRYELIVMAPERLGDLDRVVAAELRAGDQLVRHPSSNEFLLYNLAAERARGRFLFVIEAHCLAEPDCLEEVLDYVTREGMSGASVRSIPVANRELADSERQMFECSHLIADPEHWYTVLIHGFAIRREAFERAGGFDHRLGEFSAVALAATLHAEGFSIGYAPRAAVSHHYGMPLREVFAYVRDFTEGEMRFRATEAPAHVAAYLDQSPEWIERRLFEPGTAARLTHSFTVARRARRHSSPWRERVSMSMQTMRVRVRSVAGVRVRLAGAALQVAYRWLLALLWRGRGREFAAYLAWWQSVIRLSRVEYLHRHRRAMPTSPAGRRSWEVAAPDDRHLIGFHAVESRQGRQFRWTSELAAIELDLTPGRYDARLELAPFRPRGIAYNLTLLFDNVVIPLHPEIYGETVSFQLEPEMFRADVERHWLVIAARPLPSHLLAKGEARRLGVPVCGLSFERRGTGSLGDLPTSHAAPKQAGEDRAVHPERLVAAQERPGGPRRKPAEAAG